jgi:hypothetical protein
MRAAGSPVNNPFEDQRPGIAAIGRLPVKVASTEPSCCARRPESVGLPGNRAAFMVAPRGQPAGKKEG